MRVKLLLLAFMCIAVNWAKAQAPNRYKNSDRYGDSIALNYLREFYPSDSIGWSEIIINKKKKKVRNYSSSLVFRLPIEKGDTLKIINFGTTGEHDPSLMLVMDKTDSAVSHFVLGKKEINEDVTLLQNFLLSKGNAITEEYQLEIWDLFIKCRQGVANTPLYLH